MRNFAIFLTLFISSCCFHTDISYREDKKFEFIKEDGFMLSCEIEHFNYGDVLIISTYTPETWGDSFYYGYLHGKQTERKLKITAVDLKFIDTSDTLILKEIQKEREYLFTSSNLKSLVDSNKRLKIKIKLTELLTGNTEIKEFILTRRKHTYPTSNLPHV